VKLPPAEPRDRERFLAAVAEYVPLDRVVELYLFQPIRQGGVESGVAVIAAAGDAPAPTTDPAKREAPTGEPSIGDVAGAETLVTAVPTSHEVLSEPSDTAAPADSRDAPTTADAPPPSDDADGEREPRYTVFTAHYRHVLKGPERGRWEVSVVAEADAPLATVSAVVRGVQRRAGDVEPPEYMTGDALRDALGRRTAAEGD